LNKTEPIEDNPPNRTLKTNIARYALYLDINQYNLY